MYYYLHGLVTMHLNNAIIIETHGIGYEVMVAHPYEFPIGEIMFVYVVYHAFEDEQYFVGFKLLEEKMLYEKLISVKGIGPKTALNCLAVTSLDNLKGAIDRADINFLTKIPGLGKKSASQIILDLQGKLKLDEFPTQIENKNLILAIDGLKSLGFKEREITEALNEYQGQNLSAEEYIKYALIKLQK